jgi:hypothetical protein
MVDCSLQIEPDDFDSMTNVKLLPVLLALMVSATHAGQPQLRVELRKVEDSVEVRWTGTAAVVTISSRSGIGGAKLVRTGDEWPSQLTIRLKLGGLESFRMDNGLIRFSTSLMSPRQTHYWKIGKDEKRAGPPDGTLDVTITKTDEAIEIIIPLPMVKGNPEAIHFTWIDFFKE